MERVEGGDLEIWRRTLLKYFRERPFSAVFFYAFLIIVIVYGISGIIRTEDKPVHNYDGEIDHKIQAVFNSTWVVPSQIENVVAI